MAHYSSDSHLWSDRQFLACTRLEKLILLYLMHGQGRTNLPGLCADTAVNIADRLEEPLEDVRAALLHMSEDPELLQLDEPKRLLRSPLAARMDPYTGSKTIQGWYKNWKHLPESELKYLHIHTLGELKLDKSEEKQVLVWNETFGSELGGRYAVGTPGPQQPRLPFTEGPPKKPRSPRHTPRNQHRTEESGAALPHREDVAHINAVTYVSQYSGDLLAAGVVQEMGATVDLFSEAMAAVEKKCPGTKRIAQWDLTALNYVETQIYFAKKQGGGNEAHRHSGGGARRDSGPRERSAGENDSQKWAAYLHRKQTEAASAPDPS